MAGHRSGSGTGGWSGHADRTTTTLTELEAAVACSAAYRTAASGAAPVAMSTVAAAILAVSRLVAGVREVTGHPSGPQIAADTGMTVDTSRPRVPNGGRSGSSGRDAHRRGPVPPGQGLPGLPTLAAALERAAAEDPTSSTSLSPPDRMIRHGPPPKSHDGGPPFVPGGAMSRSAQHTMMRTGSTESGAEEWRCPLCARRMLLQWRPFERVVLDPGDERVQHFGAKGGIDVGTVNVYSSPRVTLPEDQARWLAENGISWNGDDAASPDR